MNEKTPYDQSYKLLFSEPNMVKDLLLNFFAQDWVYELDFTTLQRLNTAYVTENLRERESDVIWKVQWQDQWLYLLILVEFQSTIDPFMIVRMLSYVSLLYQDLIKEDQQIRISHQLPPVLPIVLYNGQKPWDAPLTFKELLPPHLPKMLQKYQPDFTCWLLDEGRYKIELRTDSLVAPLIALEQSQEASDTRATVEHLVKLLKKPEFDSIRRAYMVFLHRTLRIKEVLPNLELNELHEVQQMLSERVEVWIQRGVEKGLSQGISQGISQGLSQGELNIIKRLLFKRFGHLSPNQEEALQNKSAEELMDISERLLSATSIEEAITA